MITAQNRAVQKTRSGSSADDVDEERYIATEFTPEQAQEQTQALQQIMGPAEKLPSYLREMIDWAEKEKATRGVS